MCNIVEERFVPNENLGPIMTFLTSYECGFVDWVAAVLGFTFSGFPGLVVAN